MPSVCIKSEAHVPGFYESGRDSAHFLFDARYGAKDFFYSLRAGKTAATGRVRHTISCGALFPEKSGFFHRRQQENHRIFHSWGLIHSRLSPLSTERKNKISENATRKKHPFPTKLPKSAEPLDRRGQSRYNRMHKHNIWCVFSENATKFCDRRKAVFVWKREMAT